jgi:isocitrate/isopropylmalate dehydrogenase
VAFEVARKRNGKLCSVDKANVLEVCVCVCINFCTPHNFRTVVNLSISFRILKSVGIDAMEKKSYYTCIRVS